MKGIRALLVTLLLAAGLVAVMAGLWSQSEWLLTVYWRAQLARATDDQAGAQLGQIGDLDGPGIAILVESLNSPRQRVAAESREVLWEMLARWDRLPRREASERLRRLAEALDQCVGQFGVSAQADASQLASQLLLRPLDETVFPQWQMTAIGERVLAATEQARVERGKPLAGIQSGPPSGVEAASSPARDEGAKVVRPNRPSSVEAAPEGKATTPPSVETAAVLNQPSHLDPSKAAKPLSEPGLLPPQTLTAKEKPEATSRPAEEAPAPRDYVREMPKPAENAAAVEPGRLELQEPVGIDVDTVDLMRRLQSRDPTVAASARAELMRRGFSEVQLELALRLFDPNPEVRRQLVRVLPDMRSLDATPWLLQLCRDENTEVRRTAFTLIATTPDPLLIERLIQIARQDPDPDIQRQAARLSGLRDEARRPEGRRVR
jgi:hypothetical protein